MLVDSNILIYATKPELGRRLDEDDAEPDNTISWESIKTEAAKRWQR